ncbi:MAG: SRPBCC family protein [Planctomycetota bacterium]|nr:SRPBCC family protein [Planctomycetota bacterium]
MKLREHVRIRASPEAVWPYIANPVLMSAWNPKIVSVDRMSEEPLRLGETYAMIFKMNGRDREGKVEVVACQEPAMLTLRHRAGPKPDAYTDVTYTLTASRGQTAVEECVDMTHQGIPLVFRGLIWFIKTFGKQSEPGKPYLERLKDVVEGGAKK